MSDNNITRIKVNIDNLPQGKTDWAKIDALTDEEVEQAALADPDAQPTSRQALKRFRRTVDVKSIRENLSLTQEEFASTFRLSLATVRAWEQAKKQPDQTAQVLLKVIAHDPDVVKQALVDS
ncbi:MAG: helix-turn-helix domain-containing protein [Anaerolineales bacterium]|nr:helix-turn-helix domain-containing protein [Anaerolineales bacterium]